MAATTRSSKKTRTTTKRRARRTTSKKSDGESLAYTVGSMVGKAGRAIGSMFSGLQSVEYHSLRDFFLKELSDLYSAEQQLVEALPKMADAASSSQLRAAFENHLRETREHVRRLDQVFRAVGAKPEDTECKAMAGLIEEGDEWIGENADPGVKDVGLIAAAQRVEHYEIAGYGCVRTYAALLGNQRAADLLQATLDEEGAADKKLTQLSKRLNVQAEGARSKNDNGRSTARRSS